MVKAVRGKTTRIKVGLQVFVQIQNDFQVFVQTQTWQIGIFGIILIPIVVQYTLFSYLVTPIFIPEILIFISVILKFIHGSRC